MAAAGAAPDEAAPPRPAPASPSSLRPALVAALAGANLTLVHFASITEYAAIVGSNEVVLLLVLTAYFLGLSLGYLLSDRLSHKQIIAIGVLTFALHLTLPFSARWVAGTMARINLSGNTPPFIFLLVLLGVAPFYAVFLPRLIDAVDAPAARTDPHRSLVRLYAIEILGGILGLALTVALTPSRIRAILCAHLFGLLALLALAAGRRARLVWLLAPLPLAHFLAYPALSDESLAYYYHHTHGYKNVRMIASELSPYQRVDLLRAGEGDRASTYLYLNGNLLYGTRALNRHNLFVTLLPNLLRAHPNHSLVVAGGSLDAARYLAPRIGRLHVVELDETVVRLTRHYLQEPRGNFPDNWDLSIDDGKHFLGAWRGAPFDVISVDVPIPSHLQTAMLHSERFFALAKSRLAPGGIFSISLSGSFRYERPDEDPNDSHLSHRVMAGLLRVFRHVTVVLCNDMAYAWASDEPLGLDQRAVQSRLDAFLGSLGDDNPFGKPDVALLDEPQARSRAEGYEPIGDADMQIVLRLSLNKLYRKYYDPDSD